MEYYLVGVKNGHSLQSVSTITTDLHEAKFLAKMENKSVYAKRNEIYVLLFDYTKKIKNVRDN